jgi:DNA polymerase III epsilon subunit family exonuclease
MNQNLFETNLSQLEFTSLDLETTGLSPGVAEIVEIAAIRFQKNGNISQFNELVKPSKGLNPEATKVNGITEEMVSNARPIEKVLADFIRFIDSSILVIQNANFDLSFLIYESKIRRINFPTLPVFCTVQMTRKYFPDLQKYNLVSLRETFGIGKIMTRNENTSKIHEALDDSYAAMEVFKKLLDTINAWDKKFKEIVHHEKNQISTVDFDTYAF